MSTLSHKLSANQVNNIWSQLREEALLNQAQEPVLRDYLHTFLLNRQSLSDAIGYMLAHELVGETVDTALLYGVFTEGHKADPTILTAALADLIAIIERDPAAAGKLLVPFLFYKGFHALQAYRLAHWLWSQKRSTLAFYLQSRIAKCFSVDIHPAACIGQGVMMDHANGIVIGETSVVENNVSFLHSVTLGGTGKEGGDRHPKIRAGVMIGAGAKILGNIEIGAGARIAAGSVVLQAVPPHVTVAGVPARVVGIAGCDKPSEEMDQIVLVPEPLGSTPK